ncbi:hypothetical protein RCL_jg2665.t1 [Rhizophagus clarus]|uniref:Uncharacterized protein n=1 Tax=Rhizophagus clarus TaxID=94130 RepID=A0A8H3R0V0_9GLOM|nr:hypothetical protein RCL_jg2665.t1 [Rhizophagus clarus]
MMRTLLDGEFLETALHIDGMMDSDIIISWITNFFKLRFLSRLQATSIPGAARRVTVNGHQIPRVPLLLKFF